MVLVPCAPVSAVIVHLPATVGAPFSCACRSSGSVIRPIATATGAIRILIVKPLSMSGNAGYEARQKSAALAAHGDCQSRGEDGASQQNQKRSFAHGPEATGIGLNGR